MTVGKAFPANGKNIPQHWKTNPSILLGSGRETEFPEDLICARLLIESLY